MVEPRENTKRDESDLDATKPIDRRKEVKRRNQVRGACLRPYKDLLRRQT